jgi:hypothetical protein
LVFVAAPTVAGAEPSAAPPATPSDSSPTPPATVTAEVDPHTTEAHDAFMLGAELSRRGQWPEALEAFVRSSTLRPHPVTTYNLAYCEHTLGRQVRALKLFQRALAEHSSGATGTLPDDLLALAQRYEAEIKAHLARPIVHLDPIDATLSVDGHPLEMAAFSDGPLPVFLASTLDGAGGGSPRAAAFELLLDPGPHRFTFSAPGRPGRAQDEVLEAGTTRDVVLAASVATPPGHDDRPEEGAPHAAPDRTWVYVAYGAAGAGVALGAVFGSLALSKRHSLEAVPGCPASCPPGSQHDVDTMQRDAIVSDVGWGLAAAGAVVGTVLLFTTGSSGSNAPKVDAWISPTGVGARGRF